MGTSTPEKSVINHPGMRRHTPEKWRPQLPAEKDGKLAYEKRINDVIP